VHRANNATQILASLRALLVVGDAGGLEGRAADLADAGRAYAEAGWLLAVLGSALGADTLLARRDEDGLDAVLRLARELARREGRELGVTGAVPRLDARAGAGFEAPWALGSWLHGAVLAAPEGARVQVVLALDERGLAVADDAPATVEREQLALRLVARVRGLAIDAARRRLMLDARWFRADA
jgi:hypothetical protein